jgi:hypothetical protein
MESPAIERDHTRTHLVAIRTQHSLGAPTGWDSCEYEDGERRRRRSPLVAAIVRTCEGLALVS